MQPRVSTQLADPGAVRALAARAAAHDGIEPLNEDALLGLAEPGTFALAEAEGGLVGFGCVDRHGTGQVVVDPEHRRRGVGSALVDAMPAPRGWWAFGNSPGARALAARVGAEPVRELLEMARDLVAHPLPAPPLAPPAGVAIRPFRPGTDEAAFLAVNAAAFAHHPEQGSLSTHDLAEREAEAWFDPAGFLLAWRGDAVVGFHWTKRVDATTGEVYVIGVHPDHGGHGLGKALLDAGMRHLADHGATEIELFVEASESGPVHLYRSATFAITRTDVWYADPRSQDEAR